MPPLTNLTAANSTISLNSGDLVTSILTELNVVAAGNAASGNAANWALENLQRRIDLINAQRQLIYAVNFTLFNAPANTSPIPIGPGKTFNVANVPVIIESASWLLPSGPVDLPCMNLLSDEEYAQIALKSLTSSLPTALYYSRGVTQGNIYLLPIPTSGNQIRLQLWNLLGQAIDLNTTLAMPPAYWTYLLCATASDIAPSFGGPAVERVQSAPFMLKYREARNAITTNNMGAPPLKSDAPASRNNGQIPDYNFLSGWRR